MSIIIPDVEYADAEIWVMTIDNPFNEDETRSLLTRIPFCNGAYDDGMLFRDLVFKAADALRDVYSVWGDTGVSIEVRFKIEYVNT